MTSYGPAPYGASQNFVRAVLLLLLSLASLQARADDGVAPVALNGLSAREVLDYTTERVLAVIEEAREYADEDPERYYAAVHEVIDPVVDYRGFARGVMGEYATTARYRSLDDAGREQLRDQLERFSETMRVGLVRTYSKGLLAFGGSRIQFDDDGARVDDNRATLRQLIFSDQVQPYVVIYTMGRNSDGLWQIRNLVVENVNLGQIYRSQFEAAARRHDGDLDRVIATWEEQGADADAA
jgi:phospholipid transport system substrate-binding protein